MALRRSLMTVLALCALGCGATSAASELVQDAGSIDAPVESGSCSDGRCQVEKMMHLACAGRVAASAANVYFECPEQLVSVPKDKPGDVHYLDAIQNQVAQAGMQGLQQGGIIYQYASKAANGDPRVEVRRWDEAQNEATSIAVVTTPAPATLSVAVAGRRVFALTSSGMSTATDISQVEPDGTLSSPLVSQALWHWETDDETIYWEQPDHKVYRLNPETLQAEVSAWLSEDIYFAKLSNAYVYAQRFGHCYRFPKGSSTYEETGAECPRWLSDTFAYASQSGYEKATLVKWPENDPSAIATIELPSWLVIVDAWAEDDQLFVATYNEALLHFLYRVRTSEAK